MQRESNYYIIFIKIFPNEVSSWHFLENRSIGKLMDRSSTRLLSIDPYAKIIVQMCKIKTK